MQIRVFPSEAAVAKGGSAILTQAAREAVAERGLFLIALSGGTTPWKMLLALVAEDVPWQGVHVLQVDERVAPAGHGDRNLTHLRENFLSKAPLSPDRIHAMPVENPDLLLAVDHYSKFLKDSRVRSLS